MKKFLNAFLMLAIAITAFLLLPNTAKAATKPIKMELGKVYSCNIAGNKKKEKVKITGDSYSVTVYVNGKNKGEINLGKSGNIYLCKLKKGRVCLVAQWGTTGGDNCAIYGYKNNEIQELRSCYPSLSTVSLKKISGNVIYFSTFCGKYDRLFTDCTGPSCTMKYKVVNGKVTLVKNKVKVSGTYIAKKSFQTSSGATKSDTKGVFVKTGSKVKLKKIYFPSEDSSLTTRVQISVNGKTGWIAIDGEPGLYGALQKK